MNISLVVGYIYETEKDFREAAKFCIPCSSHNMHHYNHPTVRENNILKTHTSFSDTLPEMYKHRNGFYVQLKLTWNGNIGFQ